VVVDRAIPPEVVGAGEVAHLASGNGDPSAEPRESGRSVALIAMEVGVQDPVDLLDSEWSEHVCRQSGSTVDQDPALAPLDQVDVADVVQQIQTGAELPNRIVRRIHHHTSGANRSFVTIGSVDTDGRAIAS